MAVPSLFVVIYIYFNHLFANWVQFNETQISEPYMVAPLHLSSPEYMSDPAYCV